MYQTVVTHRYRDTSICQMFSILDRSLFLDPNPKLMGFILDRDPSSIQVLWKSVDPADKPTNQPTDRHGVKNTFLDGGNDQLPEDD